MKPFNKDFYENIVEQDADQNQDKIAKQLNPSMQGGPCEYDIPHQKKPGGKTDTKRDDKCSDMGFESKYAQNQGMLSKDIIITEEINENIQESIGSTAGGIPECL